MSKPFDIEELHNVIDPLLNIARRLNDETQEIDRSTQIKTAFIRYMADHPKERFWQSIRNFSGESFILVSDMPPHDILSRERGIPNIDDTFYREEL